MNDETRAIFRCGYAYGALALVLVYLLQPILHPLVFLPLLALVILQGHKVALWTLEKWSDQWEARERRRWEQ